MIQKEFVKSVGVVILMLLAILSCSKSGQEESVQKYSTKMVTINMDDYQPNFPDTKGYAEFKASCITCHSLRYIEMQPDFPQKTWEAIVNKMRKNFGAPISDSTATKIVNYLATVKGRQ